MSGRKYPSGSLKRKRKADKLLAESKNQTKTIVLEKFFVRAQTDAIENNDTVTAAQNLNTTDDCKQTTNTVLDLDRFVTQVQTETDAVETENSTTEILDTAEQEHGCKQIAVAVETEKSTISEILDTTDDYRNGNVSNLISDSSEFLVAYDSDPALWPKATQTLRDYFARNKPDQNVQFLKNSGRMCGDKIRTCTPNNFFRKKKNGELVERNWLIYSTSKNALFCYVCKLFSSSNDALCTTGLTDWQNVTKRLSSHETSTVHRQAVNSLSQLLCAFGRVDTMFVKENESERLYWRNVLRRVVEVIKFISQRGLSFFGDNETLGSNQNGNFLGILEVISNFDPFLAEHLRSHGNKGQGHVNYLSSSTVDDLIQVMSKRVSMQIVSEVHEAKYFGIIVDSTPDITHIDQLCIVLRYVDGQNEPVERFLTFVPIHSHAAEHLYDTIIALFKELGIDLKYCRGQSYDNASNMAGKYSGLQARLKSEYPLAEYVPCSAHSLNLVGVNAVESCQSAVSYFGFVQALYNFFSGSPHRWEVLTYKLKKVGGLSLKCLSGTRWSADADAVRALRKGYLIVSETLMEMSENVNENATTKYEAKCLYKKIQAFENALLTIIWDTLLQRIHFTSRSIQSYTCGIDAIVPLYDSLESFVKTIRDSFDTLEKEAILLVGGNSYAKSRKRRIPKALDDSRSADVKEDFSEREKFIFQTHYVICDNLIFHLNKRKKEYNLLETRFGFLSTEKISKTRLSEAVKQFQEIYTDDIDEEFVDEFLQFSELMPCISSATEMLKTINNLHIQHTYPNIEVALRIFLSIPVSNCSGERSFSAMKRIKSRLRTSMSCDRLAGLALLTMESDLTKGLQFEDILNDFLSNKSRKKQM